VTATHRDVFEDSVDRANEWIGDLAKALVGSDRRDAYRVLAAFLHTLRDRLSCEESARLAAELPLALRGVYFEGWCPSRTPLRYRDPLEFVERIGEEAGLHGATEASCAVHAAAGVLRRHVSADGTAGIEGALPESLRLLIAE
jgi:uncharacterized protein (DUF2267 family)